MSRYGGILFDKDGTLFDFVGTWAGWSADILLKLAEGDRGRARDLGHLVGYALDTNSFLPGSLIVSDTPGQIAAALSPGLPGQDVADIVARMNAAAECVELAETTPLVPLLDGLRARGLQLGVATNDGEIPARSHLARAGISEFFDFVVGFDSGHQGKPAPDMLLAFARAAHLAPDTVVMVGDSRHDLQAGRAAGMTTVGVLTGVAGAEELQPLADVILPDIGHLPAWLDGTAIPF